MTPPPGFPSRSRRGRKRGLHGEVVDELGRMIVTGDPMTNGPLVSDDLARHFDVSRTVMREALRSLESKGLITARPNVGTNICPVSEWNFLDPDVIEWRALGPEGGYQRSELYELRRIIESSAARVTAQSGNARVREQLTTTVFEMDDAVRRGQGDAFARADAFFHQHLVRACGSLILNHLFAVVTQGLTACAEPTICNRTQDIVYRHETVIEALQDVEEAERAMRELRVSPLDCGLKSTT